MSESATLRITDEKENDFRAQQRARRQTVVLKFSRFLMWAGLVTGAGEILLSFLTPLPVILGILTSLAGVSGWLYPALARRGWDTFGMTLFFGAMLLACLGNALADQALFSGVLGFLAVAVIGAQWLEGRVGRWFMVACVLLLTGSIVALKVRGLTDLNEILIRAIPETLVSLIIGGTTIWFVYRLASEQEGHLRRARIAQLETEQWASTEREQRERLSNQMWIATGQSKLNEVLRGEQDVTGLGQHVLQYLCQYLDVQVGTLYVMRKDGLLHLAGSYACAQPEQLPAQLQLGESLVGQAALERRPLALDNLATEYVTVTVSSSLGNTRPRRLRIVPFCYDGHVVGVIELATLAVLSPAQQAAQQDFLQLALESIAIAFTTAQARTRVNELLTETQQQADELKAQEEELRAANEELEAQTKALLANEAKLREQAAALEQKSNELQRASRYKSEFLARMSHELRTPLNSLLILAGVLEKNEPGNLTPDQAESVRVIHGAGTDLLNLINEILDLSKVEAGKMEFHPTPVPMNNLATSIQAQFVHVAEEKGLEFEVSVADDAPRMITTDQGRVEQIIRNLLSNAFKFTDHGGVRLDISRPAPGELSAQSGLDPARAVALRVIDTGVGLTPEQQVIIFEAFQQADGGINRRYGGTGLGLTISREMATRLGGQIGVVSEPGRGSTFTLYLPVEPQPAPASTGARFETGRAGKSTGPLPVTPTLSTHQPLPPAPIPDDRGCLRADDRVVLIVEDDLRFAKIVRDYVRDKNFKCLVASNGEVALRMVQTYLIDAMVLDLNLPGLSGWEVLDRLKHNPDTRHIPVHIVSVTEPSLEAHRRGAISSLTKPVQAGDLEKLFRQIADFFEHPVKSILLVEDDPDERENVRRLLAGNDVVIHEAATAQAALQQLAVQHFDCLILDLGLPDMSGFELLDRLDDAEAQLVRCPVIIYTGRDLTPDENDELLKHADSVILKGDKSTDRLLDETALFLHRVIAGLPADKQRTIQRLYDPDASLADKTVLVVDDDVRNAFALSRLLSSKGIKPQVAASGQKALEMLDQTLFDLVLMDIMMPQMDGYEATRLIRAQDRFRDLPILALTAKAMEGDREKCLEAGTNDYLTKPIDPDRLFSTLRVWLSR